MRTSLFLTALACAFGACSPAIFEFPIQSPDPRLTSLPTPPHERTVEVFFPGEKMPDEPYVKIKVLSVERYGFTTVNQSIAKLQLQAQQEGADALLLLGKKFFVDQREETTTTTDSTGTHTSTTVTTTEWDGLDALAIKYVHNITYLSEYVKEKRAFQRGSDGQWQQVASLEINFDGSTKRRVGDPAIIQMLEQADLSQVRSPQRLQKTAWKLSSFENAVQSDWLTPDQPDLRTLRYRFFKQLDGPNLLQVVTKASGDATRQVEKIDFKYDKKGQLLSRTVHTNSLGVLEEMTQTETGSNKILVQEYTRTNTPGTPSLRVEYVYHQQDELPALLRQ